MRKRCHIFNRSDPKAGALERGNRRFATRPRPLDLDLDLAYTVSHGGARTSLRRLLRRKGRAFARPFEPDAPGRTGADRVAEPELARIDEAHDVSRIDVRLALHGDIDDFAAIYNLSFCMLIFFLLFSSFKSTSILRKILLFFFTGTYCFFRTFSCS